MSDGIMLAIAIAGALLTFATTIAGLVWWLSRQFSSVRDLVYSRSDMLRQKMDDHERLDEECFNNLGLRVQRVEIMTDTNGRYIPSHRDSQQ